jgi:hypothetical protein
LLWIRCIKIGKKCRVRKVPQPRCIISHSINYTGNVRDFSEITVVALVISHSINDTGNVRDSSEITVVALVEREEAKQVGGGAVVGDGPFFYPCDGRSVIAKGCQGEFTAVGVGSEDVLVAKDAGEFQVGIGDRAVGICKADQRRLDVGRETLTPRHGR